MAMHFTDWVDRWQPNEYTLFRHRMRGIQFIGPDVMRRWDKITALNSVDLNDPIIPTFKETLIQEGILTPARAEVVFAPESGGEAPADGQTVSEAPIDGNLYARQNAGWAAFVPGTGGDGGGIVGPPGPPGPQGGVGPIGLQGPPGEVPEAPNDGQQYARQSAAWSVVEAAAFADAPSDNAAYGRRNQAWREVLMVNGDILDGGNF